LVGEDGRLTRGAREHQTVVALLDEVVGQALDAVEVDVPIRVERGDHGGEDRTKAGHRRGSLLLSLPQTLAGAWPSGAPPMPSVASRFPGNSNHTVWYESIVGLVNQSAHSPPPDGPAWTRASASASRGW